MKKKTVLQSGWNGLNFPILPPHGIKRSSKSFRPQLNERAEIQTAAGHKIVSPSYLLAAGGRSISGR